MSMIISYKCDECGKTYKVKDRFKYLPFIAKVTKIAWFFIKDQKLLDFCSKCCMREYEERHNLKFKKMSNGIYEARI